MEICKKFSIEIAHRVVNCSTDRCKKSSHGHSNLIEVYLSSDKLDNGMMVMDFSLMKTNIKSFIDSFDHCFALWKKDDKEFRNFVKKFNDRWIELPVSPSAEGLALLTLYFINRILKATEFNNGEGHVICPKVTWHETATGRATAELCDLSMLPENMDCVFSEGVMRDWSEEMKAFIEESTFSCITKRFINPVMQQQVK